MRALPALLLAALIMLAAPAAGQTPDATEPIDPDCHTDAELAADPILAANPELLEEPDGVCPPGEGAEPLPSEPEPEPFPPTVGPDELPAPDAPVGVPQGQPPAGQSRSQGGLESPGADAPGAPSAPGGADGVKDGHDGEKDAPWSGRDRRDSGGGAYAELDETSQRAPESHADGGAGPGHGRFADVLPGPSRATGVPDFVESGSSVPRRLRRIYQAAQARYGVRWEILAAINEIETYYGRNLNVSSAGAVGWMQFMPGTWLAYGTDANDDGVKDPYDPEDAIFSAARYLKASGYANDVHAALFAYNHAGWYVEDVLERARRIAAENVSLPAARPLDSAFAAQLTRTARRYGVPWQLTLAVLRVRGRDGEVPATTAELHELVRRLARLGARTSARRAIRRLARAKPSALELGPRLLKREPSFVERVVALAHYNKAVGRAGLVHGLEKVRDQLARRVLGDGRLAIYPGGRADVGKGVIDTRVLLVLRYLSSRYRQVTVTSLTTGHSLFTASGNVSAHSYGRAVDIAALNGTPILGHQEPGGLTERALWKILLLPAELDPEELISLYALGGPSFALADHADHIHAGY